MIILPKSEQFYSIKKANEMVAILNEDADGFHFAVVESPNIKRARIAVYDEDGEFVEYF